MEPTTKWRNDTIGNNDKIGKLQHGKTTTWENDNMEKTKRQNGKQRRNEKNENGTTPSWKQKLHNGKQQQNKKVQQHGKNFNMEKTTNITNNKK